MKKYLFILACCMMVAAPSVSAATDSDELVSMIRITPAPEQSTENAEEASDREDAAENGTEKKEADTKEKKTFGIKLDSSQEISVENKTGKLVTEILLRQSDVYYEDSYWEESYFNGTLSLEKNEKAVFYFNGYKDMAYDLCLRYNNTIYEDENYFRNLPISEIEEITFHIDKDEVPYVTYKVKKTGKEVSTLKEVRERLGLTNTTSYSNNYTYTPQPTSAPKEDPDENSENGDSEEPGGTTPAPQEPTNPSGGDQPDANRTGRDIAQDYIGQNIADLLQDADIGNANDVTYGADPDMGNGGYYFYNDFTVFTCIDENGNEVVTQIW